MIIIKNEKQISFIRKSCDLASKAIKHIEKYIQEGISTKELDKEIESFIVRHNAIPATKNYHGYPAASCISLNEVVCHGVPDNTILKTGDILNIDVTTILNGYYGDVSYMFAVGEVSEEAKKLIQVTRKCTNIGIAQVYPGNNFGNIGYEISCYARMQKYSVVEYFSGHGCGCFFHEEPSISFVASKNSGPLMRPGHIFTIEPMINQSNSEIIIDAYDGWTARTIDGGLSAQFEHQVLVTKRGVEILTRHPDE